MAFHCFGSCNCCFVGRRYRGRVKVVGPDFSSIMGGAALVLDGWHFCLLPLDFNPKCSLLSC